MSQTPRCQGIQSDGMRCHKQIATNHRKYCNAHLRRIDGTSRPKGVTRHKAIKALVTLHQRGGSTLDEMYEVAHGSKRIFTAAVAKAVRDGLFVHNNITHKYQLSQEAGAYLGRWDKHKNVGNARVMSVKTVMAKPKKTMTVKQTKAKARIHPHIVARTEVDLTGYNYGIEPVLGSRFGKLDIVFALDCTGSMRSSIVSCQKNIVDIVQQLTLSDGQDVRFALIPYRDHHTHQPWCTKVYPFTRDIGQMQKNVNAQSTGPGRDIPEAVTAALFEALCVEWREDAAKLVILMGDAGPHGLGDHDDYYPDGDPDGKDPLTIGREMKSLGIAVYGIVVQPVQPYPPISDQNSRQFLAAISDITGGQSLSLSNASYLAEGILAGARENIDMERRIVNLQQHIAKIEAKHGKLSATDRETQSRAFLGKESTELIQQRALPQDKVLTVPAGRIAQARSVQTLSELKQLWRKPLPSGSITSLAASSSTVSRVASSALARDARSKDKVLVVCVMEGKKIRARVESNGYDHSKNVQFPRDIRRVGAKFWVDTIVDAGSFYRTKGNIVKA